jgi:dihydrofolate reductase
MADLIYAALTSLDGYVEDEDGKFDWAEPDEDVHSFVNDLEREVGTYLYGRRMYETMAVWETMPLDEHPGYIRDYAELWRDTDKIVYSRTLDAPSTSRTRIERDFDADAVRRLKDEAERELAVGGAELAAQALRAGLVDELHLLLAPVVVGGRKRALPDDVRLPLELVGERRFDSGFVHLHYRT